MLYPKKKQKSHKSVPTKQMGTGAFLVCHAPL